MELRNAQNQLFEVAFRIREMREIVGFSVEQMAEKTDTTVEQYKAYEAGLVDFPFTFIHKCSLAFGIGITDILEGHSAKLSTYTVTRKGEGQPTARENGIDIDNLAPMFVNKLADPYFCRYQYDPKLENTPIHLTTHAGQELDYVISGKLKIQIGGNYEYLEAGDSIYYNSDRPHGMIAVGGEDCVFLAVVMHGDEKEDDIIFQPAATLRTDDPLLVNNFVDVVENEMGGLIRADFKNTDTFNFAFDIVDELGRKYPDKLAMVHLDKHMNVNKFTFKDIKEKSSQAANYFKSLGIKKGDKVMLVLKRHYQFWFSILGLSKIGAVAIPATNLLVQHDYEYRFNSAGVSAIVCTADGDCARQVELAEPNSPTLKTKILVGGSREGWRDFDNEYYLFTRKFHRDDETACGEDPMIMFFTSGTTGYPKIAAHNHKYPLGHFVTAKYWHCCRRDGLHLTISDTGWGKALWGKLYGQWMCEGAVFVYDFDKFNASEILPLFKEYNITTFCAPPTMYRMLIKQDISQYDLSSIKHATTAGEALNPEVFVQFQKATGLQIMEGFGQTETTLTIANLVGNPNKLGSMGKPVPTYDVELMDADGNLVDDGENGEIVIRTSEKIPCGLFMEYYRDSEKTEEAWHDGWYHTGDLAWRDEDGFLWYVGRADDVIKSSGYRIGPFEIENVIMELPYVLECGVSAAPDEIRGQVVKASIVLVNGTEGTEELKKEIQTYVKEHTAPYKYPRIVEFRDELPKTISGKIQRNKL